MKAKQLMKAKGVKKKKKRRLREDLQVHQQTNKYNCQSWGSCERVSIFLLFKWLCT